MIENEQFSHHLEPVLNRLQLYSAGPRARLELTAKLAVCNAMPTCTVWTPVLSRLHLYSAPKPCSKMNDFHTIWKPS